MNDFKRRRRRSAHHVSALFLIGGVAMLAAGCGGSSSSGSSASSAATPTAAAAPVSSAAAAANPATSAATAAAATGPTTVSVADTKLGKVLVDGKGMTMYLYTPDTSGSSTCSGGCAKAWPPLTTSGAPVAGAGVDASKLGTTKRDDGSTQVTYNGHPLYGWVKDAAPGDVTGQGVENIWYVLDASGDAVGASGATAATTTSATATTGATAATTATDAAGSTASSTSTTTVSLADTKLGTVLVDGKGMTMYLYTPDTAGSSTCSGGCAKAWPPLTTSGAPVAGAGVDASKLGTTKRDDGSTQVTYNGHPLYGWVKDAAPGDVTGQGVENVWYVLDASGDAVGASGATAATTSSSTSTTAAATTTASTVALASTKLGKVLVDGKGLTIYFYVDDKPTLAKCTGACLKAWPAVVAKGSASVGDGLDASKLGSLKRPDGTVQVIYNGHPLYTFSGDAKAGTSTARAPRRSGGRWAPTARKCSRPDRRPSRPTPRGADDQPRPIVRTTGTRCSMTSSIRP